MDGTLLGIRRHVCRFKVVFGHKASFVTGYGICGKVYKVGLYGLGHIRFP